MVNQNDGKITVETDSENTQIMIVDDEENILKLMQHSLQENGHNVAVFSDAEDAIEEIEKEAYDLIITDLKMPKLSGIEFVKKVKKISPKTDLVVMTGYPSVETAVECMKLGATDYLAKPLDLEYLNIIVEKSLYKRALEKLAAEREYFEQISRVDGLTGLYNHKFFHELLNAEIARSNRYKYNFSLLMIDIDDFKKINDNYGHQAGDTILKELSSMFKSFVRKTDPVVRYGGEEFSIILSQTDKEHGRIFADRIVNGVAASKIKGIPPSETLTISAGLAGYSDDASAHETLIKRADEALYKAKSMGKNTFCVCEDQKTT
jgi:two-component system cell cycle response regulator